MNGKKNKDAHNIISYNEAYTLKFASEYGK